VAEHHGADLWVGNQYIDFIFVEGNELIVLKQRDASVIDRADAEGSEEKEER
jgi:hypothetical protein